MNSHDEYKKSLSYLYSFVNYEMHAGWKYDNEHFNLGRFRDFLDMLGSPHLHDRFVHVAGTNGKGSVSAMSAHALTTAGFRTGLYTSPHLITFRERIRIDGALITPAEVVEAVARLKPATDAADRLTFFEVWTGLAFDHFARSMTDYAVLEVGLGGRLDATNVVTPDLCVITSISLEHTAKLGSDLAGVAREKAGIIKPGVPVVSAVQHPDVLKVIERRCEELDCQLTVVGRDVSFTSVADGISYNGKQWDIAHVSVSLPGVFQRENAAVALAAMEMLALSGASVTVDDAFSGVADVFWPGRLQIIDENPRVIVDGACNPDAMKRVTEYLESITLRDRTVALVGMCRDKHIGEVLDILGSAVSRMVMTRVNNPRVAETEELSRNAPDTIETFRADDPRTALELARRLAGDDGVVIVTGSLYLVGEVLAIYGHAVPDEL